MLATRRWTQHQIRRATEVYKAPDWLSFEDGTYEPITDRVLRLEKRISSLEDDLELLAGHLGLRVATTPAERQVVKVKRTR